LHRDLLALDRLLRIDAPLVGRGDDDPVPELVPSGLSKERVNVVLVDGGVWVVELALDRDVPAGLPIPRYQVNAEVRLSRPFWPLHPRPHCVEPLRPLPVRLEEPDHETLELVTLIPLVGRGSAQTVENGLQRAGFLKLEIEQDIGVPNTWIARSLGFGFVCGLKRAGGVKRTGRQESAPTVARNRLHPFR
jgi:hypothetical protein